MRDIIRWGNGKDEPYSYTTYDGEPATKEEINDLEERQFVRKAEREVARAQAAVDDARFKSKSKNQIVKFLLKIRPDLKDKKAALEEYHESWHVSDEEDMAYQLSTYLFDVSAGTGAPYDKNNKDEREFVEAMKECFGKRMADEVVEMFNNGQHDT